MQYRGIHCSGLSARVAASREAVEDGMVGEDGKRKERELSRGK